MADIAALRRDKTVEGIQEMIQSALMKGSSRIPRLAWRTKKRLKDGSFGQADIAQQMPDLQKSLQTEVRWVVDRARSNLTADNPTAYHP